MRSHWPSPHGRVWSIGAAPLRRGAAHLVDATVPDQVLESIMTIRQRQMQAAARSRVTAEAGPHDT
jgi:hypothetical protein